MRISKFSKLLKIKEAQTIKEEYMMGKHSDLTDRQLGKVCEKAATGRGGIAFTYRKKNKDGEN